MPGLTLSGFRIIDLIDILLVAFLFYQIYKLLRGTTALRILYGLIAVFLIWQLVTYLNMRLLSKIFGPFISVGIIALIVVFQPEIRRFLLKIGTVDFLTNNFLTYFISKRDTKLLEEEEINHIIEACRSISASKSGGLIVIARNNELEDYINTGILMDALISSPLLVSIFFKNNPLHDGAAIIKEGRIAAASCILPVSNRQDIAQRFGLRHRAGLGISEMTDAIAVIVSEETGSLGVAKDGVLYYDLNWDELRTFLDVDKDKEQHDIPRIILAKKFFLHKDSGH